MKVGDLVKHKLLFPDGIGPKLGIITDVDERGGTHGGIANYYSVKFSDVWLKIREDKLEVISASR